MKVFHQLFNNSTTVTAKLLYLSSTILPTPVYLARHI